MQRAVIYARYSPGPNQTEQSIEGQVRECTKYAELHDLRIVGTYIDRKISGKTDNRREFQRMIDDSENTYLTSSFYTTQTALLVTDTTAQSTSIS